VRNATFDRNSIIKDIITNKISDISCIIRNIL